MDLDLMIELLKDQLKTAGTQEEHDSLKRQMRVREVSGYVLGGLGAALIGGGIYLLVTDGDTGDETSGPMVSADLAPGGGVVSLSWSR